MSSRRDALDLILPGAPDTRQEAAGWLGMLASERRYSPKTVEAYGRDLRQFLAFLTDHLGEPPGIEAILRLKPLDLRSFLAFRRMKGVTSRSLMRQLAALRSFARHLERAGHGTASAFAAIRTPKVEKNLPRPLSPAAAIAVTDVGTRAGEAREPWILARDAAVPVAALRSGPAHFGGARHPAPGRSDHRDRRADGHRQGRQAAIRAGNPADPEGGRGISAPLPLHRRLRTARCSSARAAARFRRGSSSLRSRRCAARSGFPTAPRRTHCGIPSRPISSRAAATCAAFRSFWDMPPSRRPQLYTKVDAARLLEAFDAAHPRARVHVIPGRRKASNPGPINADATGKGGTAASSLNPRRL